MGISFVTRAWSFVIDAWPGDELTENVEASHILIAPGDDSGFDSPCSNPARFSNIGCRC
jgi:hypothetical protein